MNDLNLSKLSAILSVLAIILAGISAFSLEMNLDNASFVLGTLTLLVTLLIGWQIYNKIELEDRVRKELDKRVQAGTNTALFVALAQLGRSSSNKGDKADAIQTLLNALCVWEDYMDSPLAKEAYDYCVSRLLSLTKDITFVVEDKAEKDSYIKAILKTGENGLMDFATRITVKESPEQVDS